MLKNILRKFTTNVPIRGRHRMSDSIGKLLSSEIEILDINGFNIEIDHKELWCRHMYYGVYEEPLINFIKHNIKDGDIVFDPGTNLGYITAHCLKYVGSAGHIYAFEPSKTCFEILTKHNDITRIKNLTLNNAAISHKTEEMSFFDTPRVVSRGYACLQEVNTPSDGIQYRIQAHSIDDYCQKNQIKKIKFLKLDIEGAELFALQGAKKMLDSKAIDYILIETAVDVSDAALTTTNKQIQNILESNDYHPYSLTGNGQLKPIDLSGSTSFRTDIIWSRKN